MAQPRHLRNAPITEALVDFRVKARKNFRAEEFAPLKQTLADRFPHVAERRGIRATFGATFGTNPQQEAGHTETRDLGLQGYVFRSADSQIVAQFRTDGFTLNRLRPYTSWREILPIALDLWRMYVAVAAPECVTRVALRYINHMRLPPSASDFRMYLEAPPIVPAGLPQSISGFLTKVVLRDEESGIAANVAQALQIDLDGRTRIVILDIDVYKSGAFESDDPRLSAILDSLHTLKDRIFFGSITDDAVRLFE